MKWIFSKESRLQIVVMIMLVASSQDDSPLRALQGRSSKVACHMKVMPASNPSL